MDYAAATKELKESQIEKIRIHEIATRKFSDAEGQELLLHLCKKAGITSWKEDATTEALQINLGERRIVHYLLEVAKVSPDAVMKSYQNNIEKQKYEQKLRLQGLSKRS